MVSCAGITDLPARFGRLREVQRRVAMLPDGADANVTLADRRLTIRLKNGAIVTSSEGDRRARAMMVAKVAYQAYFYRATLERVDVVVADASDRLSFRTSLLVASTRAVAPVPRPAAPVHLYIVPIGDVAPALADNVASHVQATFSIPVTVLPRMPSDPATYNRLRRQINAVALVAAMRRHYADLMQVPESRLIGVTPEDMYFEDKPFWSFTFSVRDGDARAAVVSYARMDPRIFGNEPDEELLISRLQKMIAKDIGVMCYGRALSDNPRSVLYGNILGTDELDVMTEEFDPAE